jgi:tetratricopeptide (TPR) repeat protein
LAESHALFEAYGIVPLPGQGSDPWLGLGMVALLQGNYAEAAHVAETALGRSADPARRSNRPRALFLLMKAAHAQGYYAEARRFGEEALAVAAEQGHSWLVASLYNELGTTLCAMGNYTEARHHYEIYYTLREAFDDRRGMATALHGLGTVALLAKRYDAARGLFERALGIIRQVGARVDTGFALDGLAAVASASGEDDEARRYLAEALQLALTTGSQPLLLAVVVRAAHLLLRTTKRAWGPEALVLVLQHAATDSDMTRRAYALLEQYERELPPADFAAAVGRGQGGSLALFTPQLEAILTKQLDRLSVPQGAQEHERSELPAAVDPQPVPPLMEFDLDARELVLDGQRIGLSHLEYNVLRYLTEREGKAVPRGDLLENVWGYSYDGGSNVVDVVVRSLRRKLGRYAEAIETVTKVGYRFRRSVGV